LGERGCDNHRIWRAAFREGYGRNPRAGELDRYKYWHGISPRDGFVGFEPPDWRTWPAKPIPPGVTPLVITQPEPAPRQ